MTIALRDARDMARDGTVTAVLGPTNTGKTHYAIERMLAHRSGIIGFPLRLLAREVYDRIVAMRGPRAAALITGEEKIAPADAPYTICTVESMPLDWGAAFVAVDEIQLCADPDRGHIFTDRLLRARGTEETLFLGAETMRPRIAALIPKARFVTRPRLSTLTYAGVKKLSRLPRRSAVVAFSVESVYAIAELMRRQKGGVAVVMGALSPRTRNAQVALYQNGDVEHLVATDAIGMGLNLDLTHVAFAGTTKFDGRRHRHLTPQELAQIAGRAGRHVADGTWGTTGEGESLDPDVIDQIAANRFEPVGRLQWRNSRLDFGTVPALLASLEAAPPSPELQRAREAEDSEALRLMWADAEVRALARGGAEVRLLWDVCQTPDFRKSALSEHVALLGRIYRFLLGEGGVIPADWMEAQVARLDRIDGDIDALSKRLAYVRTWTYVANRGRWLDDPGAWRERTRAVEDRLSDALHDRLTQRFVDRRTSVLMQRLKQKERLVAEVSDTGDVTVEGHAVGRLEGFRFRPDPSADGEALRTLQAASAQALQAHLAHRADRFYNAPDTEIDVTEQGGLMWGTDAVGRLEPGADVLSPKVKAFVDDIAEPAVAERVARRLTHWTERKIKALFEPLLTMRDDPAITGLARGVSFQLVESLGVLPRRQIGEDVKQLDQESRGILRKHGVRFGQHHVFLPVLLKPAPTRFRILLWSLASKFDEFPAAPPPGLVTIPALPGAPEGFYTRAGYRLAGTRALRIDMLERLADMIRSVDVRAGFEAVPEMLSITGCTLEQFADLMQGLGYAAERGERPRTARLSARQGGRPGAAEATAAATASGTGPTDAAPEDAGATSAGPAEAPIAEATAATAPSPETAAPEAPPVAAEPEPGAESPLAAEPEAEPVAAATETEAVAEPAPTGPVDMEVFFTFTLAPRRGPRPGQPGQRRAEGPRGPRREPTEGAPRRDGAGAGPRHDGAEPASARPDRPPREGERGPRPDHRRGEGRRGDGPRQGPRTEPRPPSETPAPAAAPAARADAGARPPRGDTGPRRDSAKGGRPPQGRPPREETPRTFSAAPPPRDDGRPADPDSPFAILRQLKDRM